MSTITNKLHCYLDRHPYELDVIAIITKNTPLIISIAVIIVGYFDSYNEEEIRTSAELEYQRLLDREKIIFMHIKEKHILHDHDIAHHNRFHSWPCILCSYYKYRPVNYSPDQDANINYYLRNYFINYSRITERKDPFA